MCACVCVRARARVWVCLCVCVFLCVYGHVSGSSSMKRHGTGESASQGALADPSEAAADLVARVVVALGLDKDENVRTQLMQGLGVGGEGR